MKKSDGWTERLAKNGERLAEESREFFNNPAKKNGQKEREKKKGSLRDSHCSSCDRMQSAEANVWRIKRSCSSQLVQRSVARRQRTGEHFLENVRHRRAAVAVEMFKRGHEWNKAVETELSSSSSSAAREKRGSYPTPSNGVQKKNKIVAILMLLMILGHSLSVTLLLLIQ